MSSCGNFAIIGDAHGHVDMFNIQSGIHRGYLGTPKAHSGHVRGVAIDGLNQQVITAGADCKLKVHEHCSLIKIGTCDLT